MLEFIDKLMEKLQEFKSDLEDDSDEEIEKAKSFVFNQIQKSISSGSPPTGANWPDLKGMTIDMREQDGITSDQPLKATGSMLNALTVEKKGNGYFVGWKPSEDAWNAMSAMLGTGYSGSGGFEHEFDTTTKEIPVTKEMRWMLAMEYGIYYRGNKINVPPRPVVRPVIDQADKQFDVEFTLVAPS